MKMHYALAISTISYISISNQACIYSTVVSGTKSSLHGSLLWSRIVAFLMMVTDKKRKKQTTLKETNKKHTKKLSAKQCNTVNSSF